MPASRARHAAHDRAGGTWNPIMNSTMNPIAARMMFMITPAETITIRLPIVCWL